MANELLVVLEYCTAQGRVEASNATTMDVASLRRPRSLRISTGVPSHDDGGAPATHQQPHVHRPRGLQARAANTPTCAHMCHTRKLAHLRIAPTTASDQHVPNCRSSSERDLSRVPKILSSRRICTKYPTLCGVLDTSPIRTTHGLARSGWWLRRQWCLGRKGSTAAATFASRGATCASVRRLPMPTALRTKFGT
jgi:hypothetical protein